MQSSKYLGNSSAASIPKRLHKTYSEKLFCLFEVQLLMVSNKDPRTVRSRLALQQALLELLESRSLEQLTIRDITERASVGYATFFRHYATKDALLNDVAADQIKRLNSLSLPVFERQDQSAASITLFSYVQEHRLLWRTLLTGGAAGAIREEFLRQARVLAKDYLSRSVSTTQPNNQLPNEAGVILIVGGTLELLAWWLRQADPMPLNQIAELHFRTIIQPVILANTTAQS